jgi:hypothetical protein
MLLYITFMSEDVVKLTAELQMHYKRAGDPSQHPWN